MKKMADETYRRWCDAFGKHAGLEMPQVTCVLA